MNVIEIIGNETIAHIAAGTQIQFTELVCSNVRHLGTVSDRKGRPLDIGEEHLTAGALVTFTTDVIIVATLLRNGGSKARHLRYATKRRDDVPLADRGGVGMKLLRPELRGALTRLEDERPGDYVAAPGGSEFIILHKDEIFVPDYIQAGTKGWVIREEIAESLPVNRGRAS